MSSGFPTGKTQVKLSTVVRSFKYHVKELGVYYLGSEKGIEQPAQKCSRYLSLFLANLSNMLSHDAVHIQSNLS